MKKIIHGIRCLIALLLMGSLSLTWASAAVLYGPEPDSLEDIAAKAAILIDIDTGDVLYEQNAEERAYPASCTKIMTCLLTIEAIEEGALSLDQIITVEDSHNAGMTPDSSTANLATGEEISLENVLYCLMLASANEAGNILAVAVSGSIDAFVVRMNERAEELGCSGTHFCNPHGLHNEEHYTTARDLGVITREAWKHELFRTLVGTTTYTVPATNLSEARSLVNSNLLLPERNSVYSYEYAVGVKTGTTNAAGYCLVSAAEKDGRRVLAVVLGAELLQNADGTTTRMVYVESKRLLEYGLNSFQYLELVSPAETVAELPVSGGAEEATVSVVPAETVTYGLVNGLTAASFEREFTLPESLEAPVQAGAVLGSMTISYQGQTCATVDLIAGNGADIFQAETPAAETDGGGTMAESQPAEPEHTPLGLVCLLILAAALIVILICWLIHRRRRYRGRRVAKRRK